VCEYDSGGSEDSSTPLGSLPGRADMNVGKDETARAVAQYLADMITQLESMARAADLELVAYLLAMARAEADAIGAGTRTGGAR